MKSTDLHANTADEVRTEVHRHLRTLRRRLLWQRSLYTLAAVAVLIMTANLLATPLTTLLQQILAVVLVWFTQLWLSEKWRGLTPDNFLQHLNRRFPEFEESAQLLMQDQHELSPLQFLQWQRVQAVYRQNISQIALWQPVIHYRSTLIILLFCLLVVLFSGPLVTLANRVLPEGLVGPASDQPGEATTVVRDIKVHIKPPAYTGLADMQTTQLNLELPQGSLVEWEMSVGRDNDDYVLQFSGDHAIALSRSNDKRMHASAVIEKSDLYRIVGAGTGQEDNTAEVYSLTVNLDQAPDIRIIKPVVSALEIPKSGPARFTSEVMVRDDFGVQNVEILASVAKGSGEGVKFRDQKLKFDQIVESGQGFIYQKDWDLQALGMEPGDEVYFTVVASDNREPEANTGRSETLIVRWMDDEQAGLGADGLAIDFIPEFFKSQRQIIIDTEQLLEDEARLPVQGFKDTSYEIGQAQADLKQKYGQYLGDEFGEGSGGQMDSQHEVDDAQDMHEDDHGDEQATSGANKNLNSTADILRLFGHDHGDPEIGPITQRNPVALMKRAVNEMWQAERHLMQAEPKLALPFEYEAYKFLKLARQADRIYVKRLGFEPPPVSEDRRLSGELDEILSYQTSLPEPVIDPDGKQWQQILLKDVYQLLKTRPSGAEFSAGEREQLSRLSVEFTQWSQQRAALIRQAASLEKLSVAGRLKLEACETCLRDLEVTIWNLIEDSTGQLPRRKSAWRTDDEMTQSYQRVLNQSSGTDPKATDQGGEP